MKVIAVNGSPRKDGNTASLLQKALDGAKSVGADTRMVNLYDLNFKGCTSCFACKIKGGNFAGRCAMKDELTSTLEIISECDILFLGSPIYLSNVTGEMRSFLERLIFPSITYNANIASFFKGKVSTGFIYTMNVAEGYMKQNNYEVIFNFNKNYLGKLNGTSEFLLSMDTYQFTDYEKYESSMFDEKHKAEVKEKQFPIDCQKAFDMGARLAGI